MSNDITSLAHMTLVLEAEPENAFLKQNIIAQLFKQGDKELVVASNTSAVPPATLAEKLLDELASRLFVAHFWNLPYFLPLMELAPEAPIAPTQVEKIDALLATAGQKPVILSHEVPGFVGNRLQMALMLEALHLVNSQGATPAVVDEVMRTSLDPRCSANARSA